MSKKNSIERGADSGQAAEFQPILSEKALEFTASFSRVLDLVVIGFATTDEKIAVQKVQVAIDWGRHAVDIIKSQTKQLAAAEKDCLAVIDKRDAAEDCLRQIDIALGGTGEWSNNYDCGTEALARATNLTEQLAAAQAELELLRSQKPPCNKNCYHHQTHPCEDCGRINGYLPSVWHNLTRQKGG